MEAHHFTRLPIGYNLDIYRLIIEKVGDKNPAGNYGWTPFHHAAMNGDLEVCRLIIAN